jgi:hypothetical protein
MMKKTRRKNARLEGVTTRKCSECTTSWTKHERGCALVCPLHLDDCRSGGGRSHVSDVPRAYVYRASPEPPQSTLMRHSWPRQQMVGRPESSPSMPLPTTRPDRELDPGAARFDPAIPDARATAVQKRRWSRSWLAAALMQRRELLSPLFSGRAMYPQSASRCRCC